MIANYLGRKPWAFIQFNYGKYIWCKLGIILSRSMHDSICYHLTIPIEFKRIYYTVPPAFGAHVPGRIEITTAFFTMRSDKIIQIFKSSPKSWD